MDETTRPFGAKTLNETARELGLHPQTLARYVREGRLKAAKVGQRKLILPEEIRRFLAEGGRREKKAA